jgi:hypothetical protein
MSAGPPEGTAAARTGKLACASPAAPVSGCAPCLAAASAAAWQCRLRLQRCCRCCPLRSCADGGASVGGADGVCICVVGKSVLVVSQNASVRMHRTCKQARESEMPTAGRTASTSRSVSPAPPPPSWVDASVKRNCISCQPDAVGAFELNGTRRSASNSTWYGMVWCPSLLIVPPVSAFCHGGWLRPAASIWSVSSTDRQCNPRLFGDGFVPVMLALEKNETEVACIRRT